jgi:hypothetical protein
VRRAAAVLALSCLPLIVLAQTSLTDFARGAEIAAEGGSIFRVPLPDDVYDTATRPDLGDVRVLNAAGDSVPHTLREAPRPATAEAEWQVVPSFPMTDAKTGGPAKTHVRVDANGAVLEVTNDSARQSTTAYLVDTSSLGQPLTRIALAWEAAPQVTFLARVSVQGSDDLDRWRTLVSSAALAQLKRDTYTLIQSEIELPPAGERAKYLRISWPKELAAVTLTSVRVRPRTIAGQAEIRWRTLAAERVETTGAALYDTRALFPVQYVDLEFADATDAVSVTMRSRSMPSSSAWVLRYSGLFYALQESNSVVRSSPARIAQATDRYWSVETTRDGGWKPGRAPRLKVGWHPHELVFLAQGAPPYTLVYGSARVGAADAPVDALLASADGANRVRLATLGASRSLGGADALKPAPPLRRIVLWAVLVVAVGALAFLAMRVFRDTQRTD